MLINRYQTSEVFNVSESKEWRYWLEVLAGGKKEVHDLMIFRQVPER